MAVKRKDSSLARLAPGLIKVVGPDGKDVMVPSNADENRTLNMVLASQMRSYLQEQLNKYKDGDRVLSPKEIKDLAEAAAKIAEFSGVVFQGEPISNKEPAKAVEPATDISFDSLRKNDHKPSQIDPPVDGGGKMAGGG